MTTLKAQQRKQLRQIGHALQPVVMIGGQGLTENVIEETLRALNDHELIKVKIAGEDREERKQIIEELLQQTQATNVQSIGKIVLIYKKAAQQNQKLSNIVRFAHLQS
ncbi:MULTISPECIES: ribosome assembly RNA-binding protein YhbY [unclassified Acinetobacter]|uniref:ribosome assembly RNA-binding protein YhbY n=1 Tax=unclassified Acinetobacter TaxID=196816 RepID=UPI0035B9E030